MWDEADRRARFARDTSGLVWSSTMIVHGVTPILNVSDMDASFAWFAKLGWKELWRWGDPTGFGAVGSGPCEIFMCRGGQGGRGKGKNTSTFARFEDETQDRSEEHTSELQSRSDLVCRLLLEKKNYSYLK